MKVIIIHNCRECPYVKNIVGWDYWVWCEYMTKKEGINIVKLIDNPDVIPEWCPLKTLKETGEKT